MFANNIHSPPVQLLNSDEVFGTTLLLWAVDRLGGDMLYWTPEVLSLECTRELGVLLSDVSLLKLQYAREIVVSNAVYMDPDAFNSAALALSGEDPEDNEIADALQCAWCVTESHLIHPPEEEGPFAGVSLDVKALISESLKNDGFLIPPKMLAFASDEDPASQFADWADDAEFYQSTFASHQDKADEVDRSVHHAMARLMGQLKQLHLSSGSAQEIVERWEKLNHTLKDERKEHDRTAA